MRRVVAGILCGVALAMVASAEDFGPRFKEGYEYLRAGNPDAALESFRDLLTETPDSELVQYSIAAAEYEKGAQDLDAGNTEEGSKVLTDAHSGFDELMSAQSPFVRKNAGFGAANSTAQLAKHYDEESQYNERVQSLQQAVREYEGVLDRYPDHEGARTNLNHTRYLLKKMLQNPPPEQKKADDGEGGDQGEQGKQNEESEQGDQNQQQPQPEQGEQGDQSQPQDQQNQNNGQPDQSQQGTSEQNLDQGKPLTDQNIQAILDSLEDKNREEQKNLRKAKGAPRVRNGKWW